MLQEIRDSLLQEAISSPQLLSDLAGLERYIAESYDSRCFVELLQNADDALANKFVATKHKDFLLVGNDGRPFDTVDFESLCRSAVSAYSDASRHLIPIDRATLFRCKPPPDSD